MKRFMQCICLLLVLSVVLVNPVGAAEGTTWGSSYFSSGLAYLHPISRLQFQAWIEVEAVGLMEELGASSVTIQRSTDNSNWTNVRTFTKESYPQLVGENKFAYDNYVTFTGVSGNYYRAYVLFYAKRGNGTAEYEYTTESIYLS